MKRFLLQFFIVVITATGVTANSAVLGFGIDTCKKVIENVEKNVVINKTDSDGHTLLHLIAMKNPGENIIWLDKGQKYNDKV